MATPIPSNAFEVPLDRVAQLTGATAPARGSVLARGITSDSRGDVAGKLFVALRGETFDGHRYVADALARGAVGALVEQGPGDGASLRVTSTLEALGQLARFARRSHGGPVVAVGGSAGKTTTRSAVAAALDAVYPGRVYAQPGNLNNRVGVPFVLLAQPRESAAAVIEVGTNQRGEVATLARVCEPDVALVTLVDIEHSEGIGDLDEIEAEEGDLFTALPADGTAIANADDARAARQLLRAGTLRRLGYGTTQGQYRVLRREPTTLGRSRVTVARPRGADVTVEVGLLGLAGALAVAAACAAADALAGEPVDPGALARALGGRDLGEPGRLRPVQLADGSVVIDDSYNANPGSVRASIGAARELARARGARLVLVLGEMLELGSLSREEHRKIGESLGQSGAAALIAVGGDAELYVAPARAAGLDASFFADVDQARGLVSRAVRAGDVVLVKGSRGVRAERLVAALVTERGAA